MINKSKIQKKLEKHENENKQKRDPKRCPEIAHKFQFRYIFYLLQILGHWTAPYEAIVFVSKVIKTPT